MDINKEPPLVSVRLMTYNHELFIKQAMEGIMMQQTDFPIEVVVGDDFSTDKTLEIIKSYKSTEKIKIRVLERTVGDEYWVERQKKGRLFNFANIIENCSGKYIALLDGDDYWMDPLKLQKQVDFLEENEQYHGCVTESYVGEYNNYKKYSNFDLDRDVTTKEILIASYFATNTIIFRNHIVDNHMHLFEVSPMGDTLLLFLLSEFGALRYLSTVTGFYRKHQGGIYTGANGIDLVKKQVVFYKLLVDSGFVRHEILLKKLINSSNLHITYNYAFLGDKKNTFEYFKKVDNITLLIEWKKTSKTIYYLVKCVIKSMR